MHAKLSVPYKSLERIVNSSSNGIRHIFMSNMYMKRRIEKAGSTPWPGADGSPAARFRTSGSSSENGAVSVQAGHAQKTPAARLTGMDDLELPEFRAYSVICTHACRGMIARRVIRKAISRGRIREDCGLENG
ncbi:hypothetical protein [Burkholderia ubonensis]|uniref:hypothetical protein n=1 Tax=Burkholderia ubonensis TaxID=101571 RepID=UPI000F55B1A2|nr:hypothetical protein [Burkholderia ubonensis]